MDFKCHLKYLNIISRRKSCILIVTETMKEINTSGTHPLRLLKDEQRYAPTLVVKECRDKMQCIY